MIQCKCPKEKHSRSTQTQGTIILVVIRLMKENFGFHNCSVSFKTKKSFKKHEQTHSDKDLVNCSECGYEGISEKD